MFLNEQQKNELAVMSRLRPQGYINSKGNRVNAKLMPLGINKVTLASVNIGVAVNKNVYVSVIFTKPKSNVIQLKTIVTWCPQQEFIFDYEPARELCEAFGHDLKPCPEDMDKNTYMTHVGARIRTFIGRETEILIGYKKEPKLNDYGETIRRIIYIEDSGILEYYTANVIKYINEGKENWMEVYNMFYNTL